MDENVPSHLNGDQTVGPTEWRIGIKDRYMKAEKLLAECAKDPVKTPYKSKYEARELLRELVEILGQGTEICRSSDLSDEDVQVMLAGVLVMIANVDIEVEELSSANDNLLEAMRMLEQDPHSALHVTVTLSALNQLGLLWSLRGENEKGLEYLQRGEKYYLEFNKSGSEPRDVKSLFICAEENDGRSQLEKLFTHTLYYLAQIFKALKMDERSALYCHSTLKRQLERDQDLNRVEWAVNAATLSQYLAERFAFKEARHHLAAAEYFMELENRCLSDSAEESEVLEKAKENLEHRWSDVARCWVKYCLLLMCTSRDRLMGTSSEERADPPPIPPKELVGLTFPTLDLKQYEKLVTAGFILVIEEAREVFLFAQNCCKKALSYNTLDGHVTDHVNITEDYSRLYLLLAFYDEDDANQSKMHKRRYDLLSNVVTSLNPQYYIDLCRSLWMELGTICQSMAEIKLMKVSAQNNPESKSVAKCNALLQKGVDYIEQYIHSYDDKKKQGPPDRYPEEVEKDIISAHLLMANMYMKFITADKIKLLYYNTKSLDLYKIVVGYCKRNKDFKDFSDELHLSEEMTLLLPTKLARIQTQITQ